MTKKMLRSSILLGCLTASAAAASACSSGADERGDGAGGERTSQSVTQALSPIDHGHDVWFKNTYGNGFFLSKFLPDLAPADRRLKLGFDVVLALPRGERFTKYGVINDPDCRAPLPGEATDPVHPNDVCSDPEGTGVLGLRLEHDYDPATGQKSDALPRLLGISCASCHAGFDPRNPPANPAEPTWANIHPTIGSLRFRFGAVFGAHLSATNPDEAPKKALFDSWNPGTVDTTTLFDDGVNNPGVVTAFWDVPQRPYFTSSQGTFHRSGQGGEDDVGTQTAASRVYSNVGMCFRECSLPAVIASGPIDVAACKVRCKAFPPQQDLDDLNAFLNSVTAPKNPRALPASNFWVRRGAAVFEQTCASCHSGAIGSSDEMMHLSPNLFGIETAPGTIGTNDCRAQTTNWDTGKIWQDFSSTELKARGFKGYRVLTLKGMWATAPYLHHNAVGTIDLQTVSVAQSNADFASSVRQLLTPPFLRSGTHVKTTTLYTPIGNIPDFPINALNALKGGRACDLDVLKGHAFGTLLGELDKAALIEYLRTL